MAQVSSGVVDVRDMLCAQALAIVSQALEHSASGRGIDVLYSTDDVKRDLLVWGREQGHIVRVAGPGRLWIQRP